MPLIISDVAGDSLGHWYTRSGEPAYTIRMANGKERPTTLRDARKLDLVPSVTTILRVAAAPGLERWKQTQAILSALTLPRLEGETLDAFAKRAMDDSREQSKAAADRGSDLHGALERAVGHPDADPDPVWGKHVRAAVDALAGLGIDFHAGLPEKSFAHPRGFGGKVDWHSPEVVMDFKSKDRIDDDKQLAWPEHCMQLAAYGEGLELPRARLLNVFVGVEDCRVVVHEWTRMEAIDGWEKFLCLLRYWQVDRGYQ